MQFLRCNSGTSMRSHRPCWTSTKGKVMIFLDKSLLWMKPGLAHTNQIWNANQMNGNVPVLLIQRKCEGDVHCGVWHWWGNTAPRCTSKPDGKHCLQLHVPAAPPSSSSQEKIPPLGGTEPHHLSWQCKESHSCCCPRTLVPLAICDSGTSTVLTQYEFMRLQYLRQSKRNTVRDPVHHKRCTYPCYRVVNMEHQQRWTRWWCTTPSKHLAKGDTKEATILIIVLIILLANQRYDTIHNWLMTAWLQW